MLNIILHFTTIEFYQENMLNEDNFHIQVQAYIYVKIYNFD